MNGRDGNESYFPNREEFMKTLKNIRNIRGGGLAEQLELINLLTSAIDPQTGKTFMELMQEFPQQWKQKYLSDPAFLKQTISDVLEQRRNELANQN